MPRENIHNIDSGFVTQEGEVISLFDSDRVLAVIKEHCNGCDEIRGMLCGLFRKCVRTGLFDAAYDYGEKMLAYTASPEERAHLILRMGLMKEEVGKYEEAVKTYFSAFSLNPGRDETWYFLNNNLGYCLNHCGRYEEAERYCRSAIAIDPARHNAFKNLGFAHQGQGRYSEAAKAFIRAVHLCPRDPRALKLLEDLIRDHKDDLAEINVLIIKLNQCRELVKQATGKTEEQLLYS
jgi:tetratricopeptide (TPR) repeat protein